MFKHLLKIIWNKKRQNSLLISEIFLSFLVIFGVFSFGINAYRNYVTPMGFEYKNLWAISYNHTLDTKNADSVTMVYEGLLRNIQAMPQVLSANYATTNVPFASNHMSTGIKYNNQEIDRINIYDTEPDFLKTMGAKMVSGRWFTKDDKVAGKTSVVINQKLKERMFGNGDAIGKTFSDYDGKNPVRIIGVINNIKYEGDYQVPSYGKYTLHDTAAYKWMGKILVKVTPGTDAAFEGKLYKLMANTLKKSNIEIEHFDNTLNNANMFTLVPLIIFSIIAAFLIINVTLGIFGVLWYNINKRKGEIGLRRAIGAPGSAVSSQIVWESLILTTFSLLIGMFFAVQFPLLHVFDLPAIVYIMAMLFAAIFIYLLVFICSLYPGKQAASVYPAVALHEE